VTAAALQTPTYYIKYHAGAHKLDGLYIKQGVETFAADGPQKKVEYIYGPPGVGKSRYWRFLYEDHPYYIVTEPEKRGQQTWFDEYRGEKVIIIDDFLGHMSPQTLLHLADPYGGVVRLPVKGGFTTAFATHIIITSNLSLEEAFAGLAPITIAALRRRMHVVHMKTSWSPPADHNVHASWKRAAMAATIPPLHYMKEFKITVPSATPMEESEADQMAGPAPGTSALVPTAQEMQLQPSGHMFAAKRKDPSQHVEELLPSAKKPATTQALPLEKKFDWESVGPARYTAPKGPGNAGTASPHGGLGFRPLPGAGSPEETQMIRMLQTREVFVSGQKDSQVRGHLA